MDILYQKVFNNKYLFRYIYDFVQHKRTLYIVDDIQKTYDEIINSYNVIDLEIGTLLKNKQFKLLGIMFDNYIKYVSGSNKEDSYKYWYYVINPTVAEIRQLLKWNGLGFNRFKILFNEFKHIFESTSKTLVKCSMIGGNYEIFKFLLDQGYPMNFKFNHYKSEFTKFNCNGNLEIFKVILENFKGEWDNYTQLKTISKISQLVYYSYKYDLTGDTYNHSPKQTHQKNYWITEDPSTSFKYYEIYKYLFKEGLFNDSILSYYQACFGNIDLSLAKATIEIINENLSYQIYNPHPGTLSLGYTKMGIIFAAITLLINYPKLHFTSQVYNVLEYLFSNHIDHVDVKAIQTTTKLNEIIKFIGKSKTAKNCNVFRLNIEKGEKSKVIGTIDFDKLLTTCLKHSYIPNSIQEFDYIVDNPKLLEIFENTTTKPMFFKYLANTLCDLEYLKHVFNHYFENKEQQMINTNYYTPTIYEMMDSTFEIVQWLFEYYIDKMQDKSIPILPSIFGTTQMFHGNVETLKLVRTKVQILSDQLLDMSIYRGYSQLYIYLLKTINTQSSSSSSSDNTDILIHQINRSILYMICYNKLDLFEYTFENLPSIPIIELLKSISIDKIENLPPHFFAYCQTKLIGQNYKLQDGTILSSNTTRDLLLKSIYIDNDFRGINIIKLNSTKVLDYLISNDISGNSGGNSNIISNLLKNENCVSNLIRFNTKKLIYLIESNSFIISLNNIEFIIKQSILSNNKLLLNYISKSWLIKSNNNNNNIELINQFNKFYSYYSNKLLSIKSFRFNFNCL